MNKKHLIMILTAFLIVPSLVPQVCAQEETSDSIFDELRILYFDTSTEITINDAKIPNYPIEPGKSIKGIEATVKFDYQPSLLGFIINTRIGKWIMFRDKNYDMSVNINLSVSEKPDWVDVDIPKQITIEDIGTNSSFEIPFKFDITVKKTAEAFLEDDIKIKAEFKPEKNWGLRESSDEDEFTIKTSYTGELQAYFNLSKNTTVINFDNGETKILPLFIINNYNTNVTVTIEPLITDSNWNINITQKSITLGPRNNTKVNVSITSKKHDNLMDSHFEYTGDIVKLTPKFTQNTSIALVNVTISDPNLDVKIDGYLVDVLIIIFAVIAIVIIVFVIITIIRKKRNR